MPGEFGSLLFTDAIKALQERYGSRRQYARLERAATQPAHLGPDERAFIGQRDSFYLASIGATGWPYVQHRGGPLGFLVVIDDRTLAFADFAGNKQFISAGNVATDNRVAMILMDYPAQARLKLLGRAEVFEAERATPWLARVQRPEHKATIQRVFVITVEAFDWNCPQHITPRFTEHEIADAVAPMQRHLQELEAENARLRAELRALRDGPRRS
jgi:predicted pyridoxine 5'-phosphate oxidase superfamily flavin-nucleotide-binding protein